MNICPVCGYNGLHEPAYNHFDCASFGICPSCGTEFGLDDARKSHESLRDEWVARGAPSWSGARKPPAGWDPVAQLRSLTGSTPSAPDRKREGGSEA
jgi:hypothetical protein